jgi:hypothetical protein
MKTKGTGEVAIDEWRATRKRRRYPPPRVFCKKRLDLIDSTGVDFFEMDKEAAIV